MEDGECLSPEPSGGRVSGHRAPQEELDFEGDVAVAEDGERKEDGELPGGSESGHSPAASDDLEEGELKDEEDDEDPSTASNVCKYYSRGACTWGADCRFSHQSGQSPSRAAFL